MSVGLRVENLGKAYDVVHKGQPRRIWALRGVDLEAAAGEVLGIIGASGAGKTTLLRILAGVSLPTEGRAEGRGRVVPLLDLDSHFSGDMTGVENVLSNSMLFGLEESVARAQLDSIFEFAGIGRFRDVAVKRYSAGMVLRLAFSMAVNMRPDILLADDVFGVGDLAFQESARAKVESLAAEGRTVLLVEHDAATLERLCDRVVWLNAGEVVAAGAPEEVLDRYLNSPWSVLGQATARRRKGSHSNKVAEIVAVDLVDSEGSALGHVDPEKGARVRIRYRTKVPGVSLRSALDFYTRGSLAMRSVQPELATASEPGEYVASVQIPGGLLARAVYAVNAGITLERKGKRSSVLMHGALSFPVRASDSPVPSVGLEALPPFPSLVEPQLDWDFHKERELAER